MAYIAMPLSPKFSAKFIIVICKRVDVNDNNPGKRSGILKWIWIYRWNYLASKCYLIVRFNISEKRDENSIDPHKLLICFTLYSYNPDPLLLEYNKRLIFQCFYRKTNKIMHLYSLFKKSLYAKQINYWNKLFNKNKKSVHKWLASVNLKNICM